MELTDDMTHAMSPPYHGELAGWVQRINTGGQMDKAWQDNLQTAILVRVISTAQLASLSTPVLTAWLPSLIVTSEKEWGPPPADQELEHTQAVYRAIAQYWATQGSKEQPPQLPCFVQPVAITAEAQAALGVATCEELAAQLRSSWGLCREITPGLGQGHPKGQVKSVNACLDADSSHASAKGSQSLHQLPAHLLHNLPSMAVSMQACMQAVKSSQLGSAEGSPSWPQPHLVQLGKLKSRVLAHGVMLVADTLTFPGLAYNPSSGLEPAVLLQVQPHFSRAASCSQRSGSAFKLLDSILDPADDQVSSNPLHSPPLLKQGLSGSAEPAPSGRLSSKLERASLKQDVTMLAARTTSKAGEKSLPGLGGLGGQGLGGLAALQHMLRGVAILDQVPVIATLMELEGVVVYQNEGSVLYWGQLVDRHLLPKPSLTTFPIPPQPPSQHGHQACYAANAPLPSYLANPSLLLLARLFSKQQDLLQELQAEVAQGRAWRRVLQVPQNYSQGQGNGGDQEVDSIAAVPADSALGTAAAAAAGDLENQAAVEQAGAEMAVACEAGAAADAAGVSGEASRPAAAAATFTICEVAVRGGQEQSAAAMPVDAVAGVEAPLISPEVSGGPACWAAVGRLHHLGPACL
ncbi:hypothetical protein QJQ45_022585 [Haematococcus lacustris]|nr:hypothetical protein QJQ45_022585 [Haematococcus lacustris]